MVQVYYCKNGDDMRRVAIHIFREECEISYFEDGLEKSRICRCKYINDPDLDGCFQCEEEPCLLLNYLEDKDVYKNIEIKNYTVNFPCVVCVENGAANDSVTICSIADAKNNTKYGDLMW